MQYINKGGKTMGFLGKDGFCGGNSTILFFIILFLLLFDGGGFGYSKD
jgi:hypothetical protein